MYFFGKVFKLILVLSGTYGQCPEGQYFKSAEIFCKPCSGCGPGLEIERPCGGSFDTKCRKCAEHHFSPDYQVNCSSCSTCAVGHIVLSSCNGTHNTVCKLAATSGHSTEPHVNTSETPTIILMTKNMITEWTTVPAPNKGQLVTIVVVACGGGFVLTIVFIIVGIKKLKRPRKRCNSLSVETSELEDPHQELPTQSRHNEFLNQLKNEDFLMAEVTADLNEGLGRLLNPESAQGWRVLAGKLGFLIGDTNNFGIDPSRACQEMLAAWSTSRTSMLSTLACHLYEMGREDAVYFIQQWWCHNRTTRV